MQLLQSKVNTKTAETPLDSEPTPKCTHDLVSCWPSHTGDTSRPQRETQNLAQNVTVAILAQGTSWAVAVTQAFFGHGFNPRRARARMSRRGAATENPARCGAPLLLSPLACAATSGAHSKPRFEMGTPATI